MWASWNEHYFDELTPDGAYILGLHIADGYLGSTKHRIGFTQGDPDILYRISDILDFEGNFRNWKGRCIWELILNSKHAWELLANEYGIPVGGEKSYTVRIPKAVREHTALLPHFVRGLFDGDGSVGQRKRACRFSLVSGSANLIDDFMGVLVQQIGLSFQEKTRQVGGYKKNGERGVWYSVGWSSHSDSMAFARYIYGPELDVYGSDLYLRRKKERFDQMLVLWKDPEWMRRELVAKGRTCSDIGGELGVPANIIGVWASKFGLSS